MERSVMRAWVGLDHKEHQITWCRAQAGAQAALRELICVFRSPRFPGCGLGRYVEASSLRAQRLRARESRHSVGQYCSSGASVCFAPVTFLPPGHDTFSSASQAELAPPLWCGVLSNMDVCCKTMLACQAVDGSHGDVRGVRASSRLPCPPLHACVCACMCVCVCVCQQDMIVAARRKPSSHRRAGVPERHRCFPPAAEVLNALTCSKSICLARPLPAQHIATHDIS